MAWTGWLERWQLECCGDPFRTGSSASFRIRIADPGLFFDVLGPDLDAGVLGTVERHAPDLFNAGIRLSGTVATITAVYSRFDEATRDGLTGRLPVPGTTKLVDVDTAHGHEPRHEGRDFIAYLIRIDDEVTAPANR